MKVILSWHAKQRARAMLRDTLMESDCSIGVLHRFESRLTDEMLELLAEMLTTATPSDAPEVRDQT